MRNMPHVFQNFGNIFISKTKKNKRLAAKGLLIVELGQLVPRNDEALRPRLRDDHQVGHAPADVVSAHGQGQRCQHAHARDMEDEQGVQEGIEQRGQRSARTGPFPPSWPEKPSDAERVNVGTE